jgi:hypothetical protein
MAAMYWASWPAAERRRRQHAPTVVAARSTAAITSGANGVYGTCQ